MSPLQQQSLVEKVNLSTTLNGTKKIHFPGKMPICKHQQPDRLFPVD